MTDPAMNGLDLTWLDGIAQAELVRTGEVSRLELVEAAIERVSLADRSLNFLNTPMFDQGRAVAKEARRGNGPLSGVPMLLKDHLATHEGVRHTSGSRFMRNHISGGDSELVARYKHAGMVPIGTSATCEFALLSTAESSLFGRCRNPWDLTRTTGGSSGGSAAAVAAGCVPIGHGNDAGGSVRIPASCCGIFGLKPTRARNPLGPNFGDMTGGIWAEHVLTRSVRDSAAALDASAGPMLGDPYEAPAPLRPFLEEVGLEPGRQRIAFTDEAPTGVEVDADCSSAVHEAAALCEGLGHRVEKVPLPLNGIAVEEAFQVVYCAGAGFQLDYWERQLGRKAGPDDLEPLTRELAERGRTQSATEFLAATQTLQLAARRIAEFHRSHDLTLSPTLAAPPVPLGYFDSSVEDPGRTLDADAAFAAFTWIANATGQPSASVPTHWSPERLPIGVQFTAPFGRDDLLLRLCAQLERAQPWTGKRPSTDEIHGVGR